jgi:hypothetical protein
MVTFVGIDVGLEEGTFVGDVVGIDVGDIVGKS